MKQKDAALMIRINENEKEELTEISAELDVPVSQIVREAVREKIASVKRLRVSEKVKKGKSEIGEEVREETPLFRDRCWKEI